MIKDFIEKTEKEFDEELGDKASTELVCRSRTSFQDYNANKKVKSFLSSTLHSYNQEIVRRIEEKYGKKGIMSGSLGYQGIVMDIQAFQTETDKMRDEIINLITDKEV